jgi:hypothetical protein
MRVDRARITAVAGAVALIAGTLLFFRPAAPPDRGIAVYLTPSASEEDVKQVYLTVLGTPHRDRPAGFSLREGIASVALAGDEAQTILYVRLRDDLRPAERDSLLAAFRRSPLVSRVEPGGGR